MENYEIILIYQNQFFLSLFLSQNPKSITIHYKNENFLKITALVSIFLKMQSMV